MLNNQKGEGLGTIIVTVLIASILTLCLVSTFIFTQPIIERNVEMATQASVLKAIPTSVTQSVFIVTEAKTIIPFTKESTIDGVKIFAGYDEKGVLISIAIKASASGYNGKDSVVLLYAYTPSRECITGISVVKNIETAGFGTKISTSEDYLANFTCLDTSVNLNDYTLKHKIKHVKNGTSTATYEIDGITGATVTSKAVALAINATAQRIIPIIVENIEILKNNKS